MKLTGALCAGQWRLWDSLEPADHRQAAAICKTCPALEACRQLLADELTMSRTMKAAGGGPRGTWAGRLIGKQPVDRSLAGVGTGWDNRQQGHDQTSRPRTNGAATPVRGLADRKDTTDSMTKIQERSDIALAVCPTCGEQPAASCYRATGGVNIGDHRCSAGHIWSTHWPAVA